MALRSKFLEAISNPRPGTNPRHLDGQDPKFSETKGPQAS